MRKIVLRFTILLLAGLAIASCKQQPVDPKRNTSDCHPALLTSYTPLQTLDDQGNPTQLISGFDHDLASQFAESLDQDPIFIVANSYEDLVTQVQRRQRRYGCRLASQIIC